MKKVMIYESAMCCSTGLCGVGIDPELLRISTVLNNLKKSDIVIERYNLTNAPQEFVKNQDVNQFLSKEGIGVLPITVVDGEIVMTKRYPKNDELASLLDIEISLLGGEKKPATRYKITSKKSDGCNCKGGCC